MPTEIIGPTPFVDVNAVLQRLLADVRSILGDQFIGMYLYGSLALGDFDPVTSDIDLLIVTKDMLPDEVVTALKAMHAQLSAGPSKWGRELEGSYIRQQAVRRYDPADARYPRIERGEALVVDQHHTDSVIQRYLTREVGLVLAGPPAKTLIDPIGPDALRRAVLDLLWWWELQLSDTSRVEQSGYQAYAILTMCRVLYTLEHGTIVSKPFAARWAQANLDKRWADLIERALTWRPGEPMDRLEDALEFIAYTLERSRQFEIAVDRVYKGD